MAATVLDGLAAGVTGASLQIRDALAATAERLSRSTVRVIDARRGGPAGVGSGVVWRPDGLIVTNAHVVRDARRVVVELTDGRALEAVVTRLDPRRDLAALRVDALHSSAALPAARIGDSSALRAGQLVFAVGHPWGVRNAMTTGIVHAVDARRWVQADVSLAPGNSGGPLADAWGRVVGVNSMIVRGLALAVPSAVVEGFIADIADMGGIAGAAGVAA